jgi:hypothetical protein
VSYGRGHRELRDRDAAQMPTAVWRCSICANAPTTARLALAVAFENAVLVAGVDVQPSVDTLLDDDALLSPVALELPILALIP